MKRSAVILVGFVFVTVSSAAAQAARRPRERNYEATSAWDKRRGYSPTPPNNRPTGPSAGVYGTPGKSLAPQGAGNTLKSRVPYDKQRGSNGIYPDGVGGAIGPGSRIGSFGSGQSAVGFPASGAINGTSRFGKKASKEVDTGAALPGGLQEALDDISNSWKRRDSKAIRSRFPGQKAVLIFQDGAFSHEALGLELGKQVAAGVDQLQTQSFELNEPAKESLTRYFVAGKHTFLDTDGQKRLFHVSYVLEQSGERWQIAEYGVSQAPINRHGVKPAKEGAFGPGTN